MTGELAALAGVVVTVAVNSVGTALYLSIQAIQEESAELSPNVLVVSALLTMAVLVFRWSAPAESKRTIAAPKPIAVGMVIFPLVLLVASVRLILQHRNVFPWDPRPEWSTIIGLSLMGVCRILCLRRVSARVDARRGAVRRLPRVRFGAHRSVSAHAAGRGLVEQFVDVRWLDLWVGFERQ